MLEGKLFPGRIRGNCIVVPKKRNVSVLCSNVPARKPDEPIEWIIPVSIFDLETLGIIKPSYRFYGRELEVPFEEVIREAEIRKADILVATSYQNGGRLPRNMFTCFSVANDVIKIKLINEGRNYEEKERVLFEDFIR